MAKKDRVQSKPGGPGKPTKQGTPDLGPDSAMDVSSLIAQCNRLQTVRAQTEAALRTRDDVLETIALEMRVPFEGVASMLHLLLDPDLTVHQRQQIASAGAATITMALAMLDTLLDLPTMAEGALELVRSEFNLTDLVKHSVAILLPLAANEGLLLASRIQPGVPDKVYGDAARLRQVLLYMIYQAIELAETGEVSVVLSVESRSDNATVIRFAAHNKGESLPEEKLERVVSLAREDWQLEDSRCLGLAQYRQLAELMDGRLGVELVGENGFAFGFTARLGNPATLHDDRRGVQRSLQELLQCSLGPVIDLSASGARALSPITQAEGQPDPERCRADAAAAGRRGLDEVSEPPALRSGSEVPGSEARGDRAAQPDLPQARTACRQRALVLARTSHQHRREAA